MAGKIYSVPIITLFLCLSACQIAPAATPTAISPVDTLPPTPPAFRLIDTLLPTPTPPTPILTATPTITPTPSITLTPTAFTPFDAVTTAASVNLRAGPGYLFPVLRLLKEGRTVTVLGKAPGGEWFWVRTPEQINGWVFGMLLRSGPDLHGVPVIEPRDAQLIRGRVRDAADTLIRGVVFNIFQGIDKNVSTNPVVTDSSGEFFSYMPITASGVWTVGYSGIACDSNVWTDTSCTYYRNGYQGTVDPPSVTVRLPRTDELEFTWL